MARHMTPRHALARADHAALCAFDFDSERASVQLAWRQKASRIIRELRKLGFVASLVIARAITSEPKPVPRCCMRCGWPHAVRELTTGSIDCGACLFPWNPGHPVHPDALRDPLSPAPDFVDAVETHVDDDPPRAA